LLAPDASNGPLPNAGTAIGNEQAASTNEPAVVSAAAADTVAQVPVNLTTPPAVPHALAVALPTPVSNGISSKASDIMHSTPAALSPAMLAGGVSSQQMALACNSMVRLPLQHKDAPAATPIQFQLPLAPAMADSSTPLLKSRPAVNMPLVQQVLQPTCSLQPINLSLQPIHNGTGLPQQLLHGAGVTSEGLAATPAATAAAFGEPDFQPLNKKGKRQGYQIEPAALQRLIQKQIDAKQTPQQQQQQQTQQGAASCSDDQQLQQQQRLLPQQQHRPRSFTRIPSLVQQQHAEQQEQQQQQQSDFEPPAGHPADAAAPADMDCCTSPSVDVAVGLDASQMQLAASLESPDACLSLKLPGSLNGELHQPVDLDSSKVFGSAQKRLRLSLGDEHHVLAASPVLHLRGLLASPGGQPTPPAAAAGKSAAADEGPGAGYGELATPSKFFSGSPVPLAARKALLQGTPETPSLFGHAAEAATPPWPGKCLDKDPASCPLRTIKERAAAVDQPSSWVPVAGVGSTPAEAAAVLGVPAAGCFSATPASNPVLVPVSAGPDPASVAAAGVVGRGRGSTDGGSQQLVTPPGRDQLGQATPVTEA
jgi:hypothetical protein